MSIVWRTVQWTLLAGALFAVADCVLSVRHGESLAERLGTMGVALLLYAAVFGALGAALGSIAALFSRARSRTGADDVPTSPTGARGLRGRLPSAATGALVLAATGIAALGPNADARPGPRPDRGGEAPPNVILISVDTLRADRVGAYARGREATPHLDALAREGVLFETAYSTASWTLPAHASMLTGLDPFAHGAIHSQDRLAPAIETLPERLYASGFATEAWVGTDPYGYVGAAFGFAAGFQNYRHYPHAKRFRSSLVARMIDGEILRRSGRDVGNATAEIDSVIRWLETARRTPFFLFVHLYDVHSKTAILPYEAPPPFRDQFCPGRADELRGCSGGRCASDRLLEMVERPEAAFSDEELEIVECLYEGGVAYVDHELGRLFAALDELGLTEDTALIVTSDHGEAFFEHGAPLHTTLHDEVTRIPLIIRAPGAAAGKRASGIVGLADITPTVLALAGLDIPAELQGQNLVPVLREWPTQARGTVLGVSLVQTLYREGDMKYIAEGLSSGDRRPAHAGRPERGELYDLSEDEAERVDRTAFDQATVQRLAQALERRRDASEALRAKLLRGKRVQRVELGAAERDRLRALGYLDEDVETGD